MFDCVLNNRLYETSEIEDVLMSVKREDEIGGCELDYQYRVIQVE